MLYVWGVRLAKDVAYSLKRPCSQVIRSYPGKVRIWMKQFCLWGEKKSHYFTHPAQDTTNFHPHFNQRERIETWEKRGDPHREQVKIKKKKKEES